MTTRILSVLGVLLVTYLVSVLLSLFKTPIRAWAMRLSARLKIQSLRKAIAKADEIQRTTGRKCLVVFNKSSNEYEAIEKKILKRVANNTKGKPGRVFTHDRIKLMQKKSLYVTR